MSLIPTGVMRQMRHSLPACTTQPPDPGVQLVLLGPGGPAGPPPPPAASITSEDAAGPSDAAASLDAAPSNPAPEMDDGDESGLNPAPEVADGDENASGDENPTLGDSDASETEMEDDMVDDVGRDEIGESSMTRPESGESSMVSVPNLTAAPSSARAPDAAEPSGESGASLPASTEERKKELERKIAELQLRLGLLLSEFIRQNIVIRNLQSY